MVQKIQKFGGAMFTPVMLFAFAGVVIGFGTLFTTEVIFWASGRAGHHVVRRMERHPSGWLDRL